MRIAADSAIRYLPYFLETFIYYCMQCIHSDNMTDTTIRIKKEVRDELARVGSKDDSFNDIIIMLLQNYSKSNTSKNYK